MPAARAIALSWTGLSWAVVMLLLAPHAVEAKDYLNESRTIVGPPQSKTERFSFTRGKDDLYPHFDFVVQMSQGRADMRIFGPNGRTLQTLGAKSVTLNDQPFVSAFAPGTYTLTITTKDAVGPWHLRVFGGPAPSRALVGPGLISAAAMLVVAGVSVWICRRRTQAAWRWFWIGAGLWTVAVAVKFAIAIPLNTPLLGALKSSLPHWAYLTLGMIYGGAMTGLTEVLFVYLAGLRWRQMAATAERAAAIGVGAGAFEAAMLAIAAAAASLAAGDGCGDLVGGAGTRGGTRDRDFVPHGIADAGAVGRRQAAVDLLRLRIPALERRRRRGDVPVSHGPGEQTIAVDHGGDDRAVCAGEHSDYWLVRETLAGGDDGNRREGGFSRRTYRS